MINKNLLTANILDSLERAEACPLCYLWVKNESNHMEYLLTNEAVGDSQVINKIVKTKGFCNRHTHLLYRIISGEAPRMGWVMLITCWP
jgi:hypothetical protein